MSKGLSLVLLAAVVFVAPLRAGNAQAGASVPDSVFRQLILHRQALVSRGDSGAYRALVAPDAIFVDDDGARHTRAEKMVFVAGHTGLIRLALDSLHVTRAANLALVDYRTMEHIPMGSRTLTFAYGSLDTFVWRERRWLLLAHTETRVTNPGVPVAVDAAALEQYVGRYEWWPGYEDVITRRGNTLYDRTSDEKVAKLNRAATPESFYRPGDPGLLVFVRDARGTVTSALLHWPDGLVTVGRRLP